VAARAAVAAGAGAVHVHPKDHTGADTLAAEHVDATVRAIRMVAPGTPIGITTGAWAAVPGADPSAAARTWRARPDFASVNWHEDGAEELASALLQVGVGVEAGLWTVDSVARWRRSPLRHDCLRVLLEVVDDLAPDEAVGAAGELVDALGDVAVPVLLHGEQSSAWPVFGEAVHRRLDARIGLEDVLSMPDGSPAPDNTALVTAAVEWIAAAGTEPA
jgi:uncharacterized protein (DUF849 family)